jgi:hypothetical protein
MIVNAKITDEMNIYSSPISTLEHIILFDMQRKLRT